MEYAKNSVPAIRARIKERAIKVAKAIDAATAIDGVGPGEPIQPEEDKQKDS